MKLFVLRHGMTGESDADERRELTEKGIREVEDIVARQELHIDNGQPCGAEANMAKWLAADAAFKAADQAMQTHGGFGYAREYHVERYWREARLMRIAPISQEMVLNYVTEHVLDLPRSY